MDEENYKYIQYDSSLEERRITAVLASSNNKSNPNSAAQVYLRQNLIDSIKAANSQHEAGNAGDLSNSLRDIGNVLAAYFEGKKEILEEENFPEFLLSLFKEENPEIMKNLLYCMGNLFAATINDVNEMFVDEIIETLLKMVHEENEEFRYNAIICLLNILDIAGDYKDAILGSIEFDALINDAMSSEFSCEYAKVSLSMICSICHYFKVVPDGSKIVKFVTDIIDGCNDDDMYMNILKSLYWLISSNDAYIENLLIAHFYERLFCLFNRFEEMTVLKALNLIICSINCTPKDVEFDEENARKQIITPFNFKFLAKLESNYSENQGIKAAILILAKKRVIYFPDEIKSSKASALMSHAMHLIRTSEFAIKTEALKFVTICAVNGDEAILNDLIEDGYVDAVVSSLFWGSENIRFFSLKNLLSLIEKTEASIIHPDLMNAIADNSDTISSLEEIIDDGDSEEAAEIAKQILTNFVDSEDDGD